MNELEKIINKAIPLPTCPAKQVHAIATRVWLKREIEKLMQVNLKPLPTITK